MYHKSISYVQLFANVGLSSKAYTIIYVEFALTIRNLITKPELVTHYDSGS